jgi:dienelactone hydrolase
MPSAGFFQDLAPKRDTFACLLVLTLAVTTIVNPLSAEAPREIVTVHDLWQGFDPEVLPLEVETIRTWQENGAVFQTCRFTGELVKGGRVRVFAIQGAPANGKALPGVLHVHGGGQTASLDWVRFWAKRGYACVSLDFCGRWEKRTDYTDWGALRHGNMAEAGGGFQLKPTPRESSWYHWALVSRRALTLLARHPQVDPKRLGVFGISVGGSLTWMIAGTDARVKAAVPIYGCGYNYDRRNARWNILVANETYDLFQRVLSPEAHAPYISCPVLFLSATNDGHGLMDRAYDALAATTGTTYQAFSPRTDHHVEPREARSLALWMDWHLKGGLDWPKTPALSVRVDHNGIPAAIVAPDGQADVNAVDVYYALGDKRPQVRFWRSASAARQGHEWRAMLPVMDTWDDLRVFANVTYRSGVCISTLLRHVVPAHLGKARPTLNWSPALEHGDGIEHWKFLGAYTDPALGWTHLRPGRDEKVGPFIGFNTERLGDPLPVQLYTHILGDPQFQGRTGQALAFQVRGDFSPEGLTLTVIEQDRSLQARSYSTKILQRDLGAGWTGWREIVLPLVRFVDKDGRSPKRWADLDKLEIRGRAARQNPPGFARWRWLTPPPREPSKRCLLERRARETGPLQGSQVRMEFGSAPATIGREG